MHRAHTPALSVFSCSLKRLSHAFSSPALPPTPNTHDILLAVWLSAGGLPSLGGKERHNAAPVLGSAVLFQCPWARCPSSHHSLGLLEPPTLLASFPLCLCSCPRAPLRHHSLPVSSITLGKHRNIPSWPCRGPSSKPRASPALTPFLLLHQQPAWTPSLSYWLFPLSPSQPVPVQHLSPMASMLAYSSHFSALLFDEGPLPPPLWHVSFTGPWWRPALVLPPLPRPGLLGLLRWLLGLQRGPALLSLQCLCRWPLLGPRRVPTTHAVKPPALTTP